MLERAGPPDEPRDEHGRWTDGGGSDDGSSDFESTSTNPDGTRKPEWVTGISNEVKADLDYHGPIQTRTEDPPKFTVNNKQYQSAGRAFLNTGEIEIYSKSLTYNSKEQVAGVVAHEIEHQKFQNALNAHKVERDQIMKLPQDQDVMHATGLLKPPYDQKYPNYNEMEKALYMPTSKSFMIGDGVSDYSIDYWKEYKDSKEKTAAAWNLAVHETLAEMARIKYETGKFPEHLGPHLIAFRERPDGSFAPKPTDKEIVALTKQWRDLYRTIDRVNKRMHV